MEKLHSVVTEDTTLGARRLWLDRAQRLASKVISCYATTGRAEDAIAVAENYRVVQLSSMTPDIEELRGDTRNGPVVYLNATSLRIDASVLDADGARFVELLDIDGETVSNKYNMLAGEHLEAAAASRYGSEFRKANSVLISILDWLWTDIVKRVVVDELKLPPLGSDSPDRPRLWWVPSGLFWYLPVHAATSYKQTDSGPSIEDSLDRYLARAWAARCGPAGSVRTLASANSAFAPVARLMRFWRRCPGHPPRQPT